LSSGFDAKRRVDEILVQPSNPVASSFPHRPEWHPPIEPIDSSLKFVAVPTMSKKRALESLVAAT